MNETDPVLEGLHRSIRMELEPVRPLWSPRWRISLLAPLGIALMVGIPVVGGLRADLAPHAPLVTWCLTALQGLLGIYVMTLAFREAVPGRGISTLAAIGACGWSMATVIAITLVTNLVSPTVVPRGYELTWWVECVGGPVLMATPLLLVATLLAARAFPTRPILTGALCGLSAGLLADAGWRLTCWASAPGHVFGSHSLALLATTAIGAALAVTLDRVRWRRVRTRHLH